MSIFMLLGCVRKPIVVLQHEGGGLKTVSIVKKFEVKHWSAKDQKTFGLQTDRQTIIYGTIQVTNEMSKKQIVDIGDYYLVLNGIKSSRIYIDSFVDYYNITPKEAKPNEVLSADVYWIFDTNLSNKDIRDIKLIFGRIGDTATNRDNQ